MKIKIALISVLVGVVAGIVYHEAIPRVKVYAPYKQPAIDYQRHLFQIMNEICSPIQDGAKPNAVSMISDLYPKASDPKIKSVILTLNSLYVERMNHHTLYVRNGNVNNFDSILSSPKDRKQDAIKKRDFYLNACIQKWEQRRTQMLQTLTNQIESL